MTLDCGINIPYRNKVTFINGVLMDKNIAYSVLTVKEVSEDKRIIRGMATTPEADRVGDIVEPMGASFGKNLPLLWMHRHDMPVGTVNFGKPTDKGIPFEARLPVVAEPSQLKARIDEAWASVKAGLIRAVSIGFRPLEWSIIDDTGGMRFTKSEIFELSLVSVPANAGATITEIKAFDAAIRASVGDVKDTDEKPPSEVAEKKTKSVKLTPKGEKTMKVQDQIKAYRDELAAKQEKMTAIMEKSGETGETLNDAESEEYDNLDAECESIKKHLDRLAKLEKAKSTAAKPVIAEAGQGSEAAAAARTTTQVKVKQKLEKGLGMARVARYVGLSKGNLMQAAAMAENNGQEDAAVVGVLKAAVSAGTTTNATWAAPLVGEESNVYADFVEYLRPTTILGKFGVDGVPALRTVPFYTRLVGQTSGGNGYWVGEGKAKPVTKFDFNDTTLTPLKVANIAVVTEELLRRSTPSADAIIRDQLVAALRERLDIDFIDPAKAAVSNVSPASITNGVTPINSTGSDADALRCDLVSLMKTFIAANNAPTSAVYIMSQVTALEISMLRNPLGQVEFPGLTMRGGMLDGIPVITSEYVPTETAGGYIFLVNAQDIYLGDEGGFQLDMSRETSLQMDDAPTNSSSATVTPTTLVSMFQTNSVAFRAEREINWAKRRASAVAVLAGASYAC